MSISRGKAERLRRLSTANGIIAALAMDQRKSLRIMIAQAAGVPLEEIGDSQLSEFKTAVTASLSPYASAVLLDPEYGLAAGSARAANCGLIATYEMDGYENPRPNRMLALMPEYSVRRLQEQGAEGIKILLSYTPFADEKSNEEKRVLIERIGAECAALDMPFFLEPVGYDPAGGDVKSREYAERKPEIVIRSMEEFSRSRYDVDVLKVEFPVNIEFVGDAYTHEQALAHFRSADAAAGATPYIYLSAGVSSAAFTQSLSLAADAGVRFSGVLCGRATWQQGIPAYAAGGRAALDKWLETEGARNIQAVNQCLKSAYPWHARQSA